MKLLYLFILVTLTSCTQKVKQENTTIALSEEALVARALKTLKIDESNTRFMVSKVSPSNAKETIIVIPEVVNEEEDVYELNSTIVVVDNTSGKITHKLFETSKENGWFSDAIFIDGIAIDTVEYKLKNSKNAFGVTMHVRSGSQSNPYNHESISLFTKEKNSLKKVLDSYTLYQVSGEVNVNACYADIKKTENTLSMSDSKTNEYYDILVNNTITQENYRTDKDGECKPIEKIISAEKRVLKFDGETYKVAQVVKTDFPDIMSIHNLQTSLIDKDELEFLEQFPKDFKQFRSYFGWNSENDEPEALFDEANAYIDYWFDLLNKEAYKVYEPQITGICYNGSWRADAVNYFQDKSIHYFKEKQAFHLINNLSNEDAKSILFFLFDGPAPKFDEDFASQLNISKQNILNEVFETMLFDQDDIDESDNQDDDDLPFNNFSFYKNNDAYFIKEIDVNNDGIPDKIVSSERYQGEELLVFLSNNSTYQLALKTTNFSQDGGNQISAIEKDANGFVIITAFPDGGFLETHHYVSFENNRWILTHTIYKTSVNTIDTSLIYVCDVKQGIDLNDPNFLKQLNEIPEESDRSKICVQQKK